MNIRIYSKNFKLDEGLKDYINEKINSLTKYSSKIIAVDVEVGSISHANKGDVFRAEMNVQVPGRLIRVTKTTNDIYKAVDKVKDHLARELRQYKEINIQKSRKNSLKNNI